MAMPCAFKQGRAKLGGTVVVSVEQDHNCTRPSEIPRRELYVTLQLPRPGHRATAPAEDASNIQPDVRIVLCHDAPEEDTKGAFFPVALHDANHRKLHGQLVGVPAGSVSVGVPLRTSGLI